MHTESKELEHAIRERTTGPEPFVIDPPRPAAELTVDVSEYGADGASGRDNYEPFRRAIEHCRRIGASKLAVPPGVYHFRTVPDDPEEAQIDLRGLSDFTFEGGGAELVFSVVHPFVRVRDCLRFRMAGLTLDWNWEAGRLSSIGVVRQVDPDGGWFDCFFPAGADPEMSIRIVGPMDPRLVTPGCEGGVEFRPGVRRRASDSQDEDSNGKMNDLVRELSGVIGSIAQAGPDLLRVHVNDPAWCRQFVRAGQVYHFRHYEYDATAFDIHDGSHLTFEDLTLYSCPGNGFHVSGDIHHFRFAGCRIAVRPGTDRFVSCATDCFHISYSQGYFIIENCEFSHAGDDCLNLHDNSSMGAIVSGPCEVTAERVRPGRNPFRPGDPIEFRNRDLSPAGFSSVVREAHYDIESLRCRLVFEDPVPAALDRQSILFNRRFDTSNYILRGNTFHSNRARGMLIHGSNGLIENNRFSAVQGAAVQIETGAESRWAEGYGVRNVIFRGNRIENCDVNRWVMAVFYMGVYLPDGRTREPVFEQILIERNTFVHCPRLAMFLSSCRHVLVSGNVLVNTNTAPMAGAVFGSSQGELPIYGERYRGSIMISHASHVVVSGNRRIETIPALTGGGIYADPDSVDLAAFAEYDNIGFKEADFS